MLTFMHFNATLSENNLKVCIRAISVCNLDTILVAQGIELILK
jgi:hypothetical protein